MAVCALTRDTAEWSWPRSSGTFANISSTILALLCGLIHSFSVAKMNRAIKCSIAGASLSDQLLVLSLSQGVHSQCVVH